jgi:hypothetical protein
LLSHASLLALTDPRPTWAEATLAGAGPPDPSPVHPPALQLFDLALVDLLQIVLTSAIGNPSLA